MATTYKIKSGDTLSGIAAKYGVTVSAIQKANPTKIKNVNVIIAGETITIPTNSTSSNTSKGKDYSAIGKQVEVCLKDIENLASFKKLKKLI